MAKSVYCAPRTTMCASDCTGMCPSAYKKTCRYNEDDDDCPGIGCNGGCTCQVITQGKAFNDLTPAPDYPFNGHMTADEE